MGLAKVYSGGVAGVEAFEVEIEASARMGDPLMIVVGLPDAAVRESKDRVWTAIGNSALSFSPCRMTVNLAPADVRKEGPSFDLPIALSILLATEAIEPRANVSAYVVVGELALSGEVRRVRGVLPIAIMARKRGFKGVLVPCENAEEAAVVDGLEVYGVANLREAVDFLEGKIALLPTKVNLADMCNTQLESHDDFSEVKGQVLARRALEVAVSGGHGVLMIGSPGCGKSLMARRIPSILPPMTLDEALESTQIHSVAGALPAHQSLLTQRPFRSPHHTASDVGLLGGGMHLSPGEVSLAHGGVLFLDELPEFPRNVLEVLRQPLEDGHVTITRASGTAKFPSRFMLVAAMNPCPCGYAGDPKRECRCLPVRVQSYRDKISGPLLDRIDIHINVPAVHYQQMSSTAPAESSAAIRERVVQTRSRQTQRFGSGGPTCNAHMRPREVHRHCVLTSGGATLLKMAMEEMGLTGRAYDRILKVARTIADMDAADQIAEEHLQEAISYRTLDRMKWN